MASLLKKPLKLALVQLAAGAYDCYLTPSPPPSLAPKLARI